MEVYDEFAARRTALLNKMEADSIAIIPSAKEKYRNSDCQYLFRQDSDFFYLTGYKEPNAILILVKEAKQSILFHTPLTPEEEKWQSPRPSRNNLMTAAHFNEVNPIAEFPLFLKNLLEGTLFLYYTFGKSTSMDATLAPLLENQKTQNHSHEELKQVDINPFLHEMRLIKSTFELSHMRKAAEISARAHCLAMQACSPGMHEYSLQAVMHKHFIENNCPSPAYNSIIAAGKNACILHYEKNNTKINENDLILIDAGAEYDYYASDVTRTFPAKGKFNAEQKALYSIVLQAQKDAITLMKCGTLFTDIQKKVIEIITDGLCELGILKGNLQALIEKKAYLPFYMHGASHWLGLDTHDVGEYRIKQVGRPLEEGMVLTIEPGLYISPSSTVDEKWWNIGIRIEDDIAILENGNEVLSHAAPKEIADIEALMNE
jgi:Xaa-Pro aminopeptidase